MVQMGMPLPSPNSPEATIGPGHPFFELIDEAYRVFDYLKPTHTGVCERCCMDPKIEDSFLDPAIRQLPLAYIRDWYNAAYSPEGVGKDVWGYLIPRILEVLAFGEEVSPTGIEVSLNRFATGDRDQWSGAQWQVLDRFQRMYLARETLTGENHLDDVLCMFGLAGWRIDDLLSQVAASADDVLIERLWRDWCEWVVPGREEVWMTAFWEEYDRSMVFDFYTSDELYAKAASLALSDGRDPRLRNKALSVAGVIEANMTGRLNSD